MTNMIRVLYIDDEPGLLMICKKFLESNAGFAVDTLTNAQEGLAIIPHTQYDAIVSDYQMPDMNGIEFLKSVRASGNTIPFILFTGRGREEVVIQALNEGADFYLQKGGEPRSQFTELAYKIRQAVARRQVEQSLVDSEKRLSDIINFLPDATFAIDRSGSVITWNRAIEEMTGVPAADMLGKRDFEYAIPFYGSRRKILIDLIFEPDEVIAENYTNIIREKDILIADTTLPRPKGRLVTLMGKASPLYDGDGNIAGAIESIRDITDRKRAETELIKSEIFTRVLLDAIPTPVFYKGGDGIYLGCNQAFTELTGTKWEDLVGKTVFDLWPPELASTYHQKDMELLQHPQHQTYEFKVRDRDGQMRPVIYAKDVFTDESGRVAGIVGAFVDISDRVKAERELSTSEERFRTIFNTAQVGMVLIDPATHRILQMNTTALDLIGAVECDVIGSRCHKFLCPAEEGKCPVTDLGQSVESSERILNRFDGSQIPVLKTVITTQVGETPVLLESFIDLSVVKRAQDALIESEEKYRTFMEASTDGALLIDAGGRILAWNPAAEQIFGISMEEALELNILDLNTRFVIPEHRSPVIIDGLRSRFEREFPALFLRTSPMFLEVEIVNAKERRMTIQQTLFPIHTSQGTRIGCIVRDVTEQRAAERKVQESMDLYCSVIDNIQDVYYRSDMDGSLIMVSPSGAALLGYDSVEEGLGKPIADNLYFDPAERAKFLSDLEKTGSVSNYEIRLKKKDGTLVYAATNSHYYYGPSGAVAGVEGIIRDITDMKRAEEETLREVTRQREEAGVIAVIASHPDLITGRVPELLHDLTEAAGKVLRTERAGVWFFNEDGTQLVEADTFTASLQHHSSGAALMEHEYRSEFQTLRIEKYIDARDVLTDPRVAGYVETYFKPNRITALLDAVIRVGGTSRGVLCFEHVDREHSWEADEITFACQLADQIALAVSNREQKKAENAFRMNEERFRTLVETSPDMVWEIDPLGTFTYISPRCRDVLGFEPSELVGQPVALFVAEHARDFVIREIRKHAVAKTGLFTIEVPAKHKDGRDLIIEIRSAGVLDDAGNLIGLRGTARDITVSRNALSALAESEELYRRLIATVPDIIVRTDLNGMILYANKKALEMGGYVSDKEIIGTPVFHFFAPEDLPRALENTRLMFEQQLGPVEYTFITRGGGRHFLEINGDVLIRPDGTPYGMVYVGRDVTQRKNTEDAIRNAHRQLNLLSSVTRHDILNKVSVQLGLLELAQQKVRYSPEMDEFIAQLMSATESIRDQIEFTRIYQDLGTHEPLWQELHRTLAKIPVPPDVSVEDNCSGIEILSDVMLEKVFGNLVDNAIRHGGGVTKLSMTAGNNDDTLVIRFEDNGVGIPRDDKEKIFERGYGKNTGLGLFLVREILAITGITIHETGSPGMGARFEITVPKDAWRRSAAQ